MPETWSAWIALVGALIGTVTGILSLILAYAAIHRDRSYVSVTLTREYGFVAMINHRHPGVKFGSYRTTGAPENFYVLSAVNSGLRTVHIEKAATIWVDPAGAGSVSTQSPHDVLLSEEHRRTAFAIGTDISVPGAQLWQIALIDDTGREYSAFGPKFTSWITRWRWEHQRDRIVSREQAAKAQKSSQPILPSSDNDVAT
jgi:hypothetical protein